MMRIGTVFALLASFAGGAVTSQAPELAQQYRQRLNGALQELRQVVAEFEADAARNDLEREEALTLYERTGVPFLRDRSRSMREIIERFDHLDRQSARFDDMPAFLRPMVLLTGPDGVVLNGAVRDFEPAVPLTAHGAVWTGGGLLIGFGLFKLLAWPFRRRRHTSAAGRRSYSG